MGKLPQEYYDKVNQDLADKYLTTPRIIGAIRGVVIQEGFGFIEYLDFIELKLNTINSPKKKSFYMDIFIFIRKLDDEKFADITQESEFKAK